MRIKITQNKTLIIDNEDYNLIKNYKWHYSKNRWGGYVAAVVGDKTIYLHRLIMKCPKGKYIDHINHNGLDNRKANLRLANQHENNGNMNLPKHNTSGYKGVSFYKGAKEKHWIAYITNNRKKIHLGYFKTPQAAAIAYNRAALIQWGDFAMVNMLNY